MNDIVFWIVFAVLTLLGLAMLLYLFVVAFLAIYAASDFWGEEKE